MTTISIGRTRFRLRGVLASEGMIALAHAQTRNIPWQRIYVEPNGLRVIVRGFILASDLINLLLNNPHRVINKNGK